MADTPRPAVEAGIAIGQIFLGKYRVESILGHGGMGVVAKCTHLGLNEMFAIKMLRQDVLMDRDATERFTREAQSASKLKSEHVARVIDVGTSDAGVPYMVMEFLDGQDLGQLVDERGSIQAPFASMLMLQAAEALCEAHANSIVHRDVKPSNLFVTWRPDGSALVKVLDFGISKSPSGTDMKLTQTQSLLGTPAYMSPEQMRSARLVDMRTDIWSLGTVFYELLEGRRPFEAESFSEMCVKVAVDPPTPMVNAPPAIQAVIMRCLAKNPDQRYANMAELARDLLPHVQDVHQGTLLVDRMQRLLGRRSAASGDNWEAANSSAGVGRVPVGVRDAGSAPVASPWLEPSPTPSPFGSPNQTPDPRAPTATIREGSAPARALSEIGTVTKRPTARKKFPVFLLGFAAIGVAIGLALYFFVFDSKESTPSTHVLAPSDAGKSELSSAKLDDPKPGPEPKPADSKTAPIAKPDPQDEAVVVAVEDLAKFVATKPSCDAWAEKTRASWKDGGVAGLTRLIDDKKVGDKKVFEQGDFKGRLEDTLPLVSELQKKCADAKVVAKNTGKQTNAGISRPPPPPKKCAAGEKLVRNACVKEDVKPPVIDTTPKPPDPGTCPIAARLPSGKCPKPN